MPAYSIFPIQRWIVAADEPQNGEMGSNVMLSHEVQDWIEARLGKDSARELAFILQVEAIEPADPAFAFNALLQFVHLLEKHAE